MALFASPVRNMPKKSCDDLLKLVKPLMIFDEIVVAGMA